MLTKEPTYQIKRYICIIERETVGNRIYRGLNSRRQKEVSKLGMTVRTYEAKTPTNSLSKKC